MMNSMFDRLGSFLRSYLDGEDDLFSKPAAKEKSYSTNNSHFTAGSQNQQRGSNTYQYSARQQYSSGRTAGSGTSSSTTGSSSYSGSTAGKTAGNNTYSGRTAGYSSGSTYSSRSASAQGRSVPVELFKDFIRLGLTPGASIELCKAAHKTLLKKYHPDRHAGSEMSLIRANEMSSMINMSYQRICHWLKTGRIE